MSLLATPADFEPTPEQGPSALYWEPGNANGQTGYRLDFEMFQKRVDELKQRLAPNGQKTAIWGCGWGALVNLAVQAGYDAHGYDASSYAIARGQELLPGIASRLHLRDATVSGDMTLARQDAGLVGQQRFALLVTEELLANLTDAEIATAVPLLRGICSTNLGHILTVLEQAGENRDTRINWKTTAEWKALLVPPDLVLGVNGEVL